MFTRFLTIFIAAGLFTGTIAATAHAQLMPQVGGYLDGTGQGNGASGNNNWNNNGYYNNGYHQNRGYYNQGYYNDRQYNSWQDRNGYWHRSPY